MEESMKAFRLPRIWSQSSRLNPRKQAQNSAKANFTEPTSAAGHCDSGFTTQDMNQSRHITSEALGISDDELLSEADGRSLSCGGDFSGGSWILHTAGSHQMSQEEARCSLTLPWQSTALQIKIDCLELWGQTTATRCWLLIFHNLGRNMCRCQDLWRWN